VQAETRAPILRQKNAKDGAASDTLLGDQFQDIAAVIDYVYFSGVVLAER
jgi:hypothetical protein